MSFANPSALALFLLAIPIALLYLIRVRPREMTVSTDRFWDQVFAEQTYRTSWQRLRNVASMLIQLALLGLLVAALAEPFWISDAREARRIILVIDHSASMSAKDGSPTRLDDAKREARRLISELRARDEAAIIEAGSDPRVVCGLTSDRRILGKALDTIGPSECPTRIIEAVDLARLMLAGHAKGQVEVFTDGGGEGAVTPPSTPDVILHPVGRRSGNVGITRFQARRSLQDPAGYQILIEVGNYSDAKVECSLDIERDGLTVDVLPLSLAPGEVWRTVLDKASTEGGRLLARIDREDALACDNRAWAILSAREPMPVTLIEAQSAFDDLYLEKVLEANPLVRQPLKMVPAAETGSKLADGEIRIYHRWVPAQIPPGPSLVIDPANSCDLWEVGEPVRALLVGSQDRTSLLLSFVKLENVVLADARSLKLKGKARVLASFTNGEPLIATFERPEGKVLVLAASLDDPADLPLRTAFPILVGNALTWLDHRRDDLHETARAGSVVELSGIAIGSRLWSPDGREQPSAREGDRLSVGPLDQCGVWRIASKTDGPAVAEVACNLASPSESDVRPPKGFLSLPSSTRFAVPGVGTPWFALLVAAFCLVVVEWRLYQRRWVS